MKFLKKHLNLVNVAFASLIISAVALVISWQANEIARSSIRPDLLIGAISVHPETELISNQKTLICKYRIRMLNTGGVNAVLTSADVKTEIFGKSTSFTINDFHGSGETLDNIMISAYFDNKNIDSYKIGAHDVGDILFSIEFYNKKQNIIGMNEEFLHDDYQGINSEITLKFPDSRIASAILPSCAYIKN